MDSLTDFFDWLFGVTKPKPDKKKTETKEEVTEAVETSEDLLS